MKTILKISILFLAIDFSCQTLIAQKASDVLENGLHVKNGEKIFLQYGNKILKYCVAKSLVDITNPPDFTTLPDSIIFLIDKNEANIYLYPPLNPLNNSYTNEIKELPDPINEAAATAIGSIINILTSTYNEKSTKAKPIDEMKDKNIESNLDAIQYLLKKDSKKEIKSIFDTLRNLTFIDETYTINSLARCNKEIIIIQNHFNKVDSLVKVTKELIDNYSVNKDNPSITKFIYYSFFKDICITAEEQNKRLEKLLIAYRLVKAAQETASICGSQTG